MKQINFNSIKNVLILRIGKIGDIIISSFVFRALKEVNPNLRLELITLKKNEDVLRCNPFLDKIHFVNKNLFSLIRILPLHFRHFDLVIDLNDNPSTTSSILLAISNSQDKLGFNFEKQQKYLTIKIEQPDKNKTHLVERYAYLLTSVGLRINPDIVKPELFLDEKIDNSINENFASIKTKNKIIAINISASAKIRKYPAEKWIDLINILRVKFSKLKFLILSDRVDKKEAEMIINSIEKELLIFGEGSSFQHFASKIKNSDLLITPDTSAVHIASAFKVPVIALFPDVNWNFISFAPYKTNFRAIKSSNEEIKTISVQEIFNSFESLIKELNW
ncbi:MAG: glycosyltransferase family 9 protein [Ignavibacteria bacterium]